MLWLLLLLFVMIKLIDDDGGGHHQDRFPRIGLIVTSSQSQNREKTIAS